MPPVRSCCRCRRGLCGQLLAVSLRSRALTEDMITPPLLCCASAPLRSSPLTGAKLCRAADAWTLPEAPIVFALALLRHASSLLVLTVCWLDILDISCLDTLLGTSWYQVPTVPDICSASGFDMLCYFADLAGN